MASTPDRRLLDSGIEVKPLYRAADAPAAEPEPPGAFPFTRGPYPDMYRGRPWTIRQYAGFASAEESNERYRYLLARGQTGLSIAFDLPTQLGYDSDDPRRRGRGRPHGRGDRLARGHGGAARRDPARRGLDVDDDQRTGGAPAPPVRAGRRGAGRARRRRSAARCRTTSSRSTSRAGTTSSRRGPRCGSRPTCSPTARSGSRAGTRSRSPATTSARRARRPRRSSPSRSRTASPTARRPSPPASPPTRSAPGSRSSSTRTTTSSRRSRSSGRHARCGRRSCATASAPRTPKAQALRFHAQTGGSTLTAQQPENNIVRVAVQALAAVCGGAQSLHTNSFDEALALPSEHAATIALRTQQILMHEAGTTDTADPLGGSYYLEALTAELEAKARELIERVDELGGAVAAIEAGLRPGRDRGGRLPVPGRRRGRRPRRRRRQRVHPGDRGALRAPPRRPRRRAASARAARARPQRAQPRGGRERPRARARDGGRHRQPAPAAPRSAPRALHDRRDLRCPPGALGHLRRPSRARG